MQKETYWKELLGNKYRVAFHPAMLLGDGYRVYMSNKVVGDSKSDKTKFGVVRFDRSYIVSFLIRRFLTPLKLQSPDEVIELVWDACLEYFPALPEKQRDLPAGKGLSVFTDEQIPF